MQTQSEPGIQNHRVIQWLPLLFLLALPAVVKGQDYTYTTNADNTITITGYTGPGGDVIIPETINGLLVTCIGDDAFEHCTSLASVTIPDSVTSIGDYVFSACYDLESVIIGNSVTNIGYEAFLYCGSLTSIVLGNSLTSIGPNAFDSCPGLTTVTIGTNVTSIGDWAFAGCNNLRILTIPNSVTNIGNYAFYGGYGWEEISLSGLYFQGNAPTVGSAAFYGDDAASVYYLPEATGWGTTFGGLPTGLWDPQTEFGYTINEGAIAITGFNSPDSTVTIPSTLNGMPVTSIGNWTFWFDRNLNRAAIPNSITNIGEYAFANCYNLTEVYFLGNTPSVWAPVGGWPTDATVFENDIDVTVYYLPGTSGWGSSFCYVPAAELNLAELGQPKLRIALPKSGQRVNDTSFTVSGTASDNQAVWAVLYQLNNGGWYPATTDNFWTNWSVQVTLTPGTNVVEVYAVDPIGNSSATNCVSFQYVVTNQLYVLATGLGTISPNYNKAWLEIGRNYRLSASPGSGFMFTNWTGGTSLPLGWLTNGTTVEFLMQSNLILQANFVDTQKPKLSITNLTSGQRVSNAVFTVKGRAEDNWMVSNVWCQINGQGWNSATNINHWTNWSAGVTLTPGTNKVQAYAVDTSGNLSTTNSVSFQYLVTNRLRVSATGLGSISPNYSNAWLEIGRNYSMTATPARGFIFTNWGVSTNGIGWTETNRATMHFMMVSNLTLQVNFLETAKPSLTIAAPTAGQHLPSALATVVGTASDDWKVVGVWYQLNSSVWNQPDTTDGWANWTTTVELRASTNTIRAYALNLGGNFSATNTVSFVSSNAFKLLLVFTAMQPLATNGLNFALQISEGLNGHIQVSTNLSDWTSLTNFVGTNAVLNFRDAEATNFDNRYYRAVIP